MTSEALKNRRTEIYAYMYLVCLAVITLMGMVNTTVLPVRFGNEQLVWASAGLAAVILFGLWCGALQWKSPMFACALLIGVCLMLSRAETGHRFLLELALLIIGACGVSFRRILITYLGVSVPFLVTVIILSLTGVIENLVFFRGAVQNRNSFGFIYPTDFCAHVFFLTCCWFYLRWRRLTLAETAGAAVLGVLCQIFCDAHTALLVLVLLSLVTALIRFCRFGPDTDVSAVRLAPLRKPLGWLLFAGTVLPCAASIGLSWSYSRENRLMELLNRLFSDRLRLGHTGFERYRVTAFGQIVESTGNGGTAVFKENYFFLDSSYMYILLNLGLLTLLAVMFILVYSAWRELARQRLVLLAVITMVCVQCFMEHHLISIGYHPFLLLLTAQIDKKEYAHAESIDRNSRL